MVLPAHHGHIPTEAPIACSLSAEALAQRRDSVLQELIEGQQELQELEDGYALRFLSEEIWATRLLSFISSERECCPFFTFALVFEPQTGPIWLQISGPEGTKEMLGGLFRPHAGGAPEDPGLAPDLSPTSQVAD